MPVEPVIRHDPAQVRLPATSQVLVREYLSWQVMRTRQLLDYLQQGAAGGEATAAFIDAYGGEISALAGFPDNSRAISVAFTSTSLSETT